MRLYDHDRPRKTNWFKTRSAMCASLSHKKLRHYPHDEECGVRGWRPVFHPTDAATAALLYSHGFKVRGK